MIEIVGVKKRFGANSVLKGVNLIMNSGEIFGIAGRSGAGKSTLLRCINGLETWDEGTIKVDGTDSSRLSSNEMRKFRKSIGMIFQNFSLLKQLDVYGNIALPMRCWGYHRKHIDSKVKELLEMVEISDKIQAYPSQLSGGQKQRVAIARALAMEPRILLCDEATSALDPNTAASILTLLKQINAQMGITIVIVTHQMQVIRSVCQRVAVIENGLIMACDEVEKVFIEEPRSLQNLMGPEYAPGDTDSGTNIKVILKDTMTRTPLFSKISRDLGVDLIILSAETNRFRDTVTSTFVINVPNDNVRAVKAYLDGRKIINKLRMDGKNQPTVQEDVNHV